MLRSLKSAVITTVALVAVSFGAHAGSYGKKGHC